ncbi:small secreted hydrophilic protein [Streptomyces sp. bgisy027]|uniref:small secreted hydrophilic protein n=1 Tax=Streptomyces sp. bgisy027 TaxID=3413770 RepID=UPI003D71851B
MGGTARTALSHGTAALTAVVAIPLAVAATSFALTYQPRAPEVPPRVEPDSGSPTPTPSDEVVSRPPVTDSPASDDGDDASDEDLGEDR